MKTSHLQKGVVLVQKRPVDVWSYFSIEIKKKHLINSLPQPFSKWLRELPACHYGEVDQSAHVNTTFHETWCWLWQAPTILLFFNCTLQYTRHVVEYSVIVGRSLVWLEKTSTPLWPFCCFPRFYRPSDNDRAVRVRGQFDSVRKVWCLGYRVRRRYLTANIKMVNWTDCGGQRVSRLWQPESAKWSTIDSSTVILSYHPTQLR